MVWTVKMAPQKSKMADFRVWFFFPTNISKYMMNQRLKLDPQAFFGLLKRMNGLEFDLGYHRSKKIINTGVLKNDSWSL